MIKKTKGKEMKYRKIVIHIPLTEEAADTFDKALYEHDDYFKMTLSETLVDVIDAHCRKHGTRVSDLVQTTAEDVAKAMIESFDENDG